MSIVRPLTIAFAFLTRLPVRNGEATDTDIGRTLAFFPVVGWALGVTLSAAAWSAGSLPPPLTAVALIALLAAATGGLHLDGLADVFDALGGGHGDRERMLTIMRDSRIGAHGALALFLVILAKALSVGVILQRGVSWPIVLFPVVGRWAVVPLIVGFPYVREVGVGRTFSERGTTTELMWATMFMVALLLWAGGDAVAPTVLALAAALGFGVWMRRRLGGLTGDVYGAAIELAEVVFLAAATRGS